MIPCEQRMARARRSVCHATLGQLFLGGVLTLTLGCRSAPAAKLESPEASDSDDEPPPTETVFQQLPPMHIGVLRDEDETPCAEERIAGLRAAVTALGRLWLLDERGHLSSIDRTFQRVQSHLVERTVDAIRRSEDGSLLAVLDEADRWRIVRRDASGWHHVGDLPAGSWMENAFTERKGRAVIATNKGRTWWSDARGRIHLWSNSSPYRRAGSMSAAATSDGAIYVGRNAGEFGGSLALIHAEDDGRPTTQEEALYGPITDIVVDPMDRRCVIASQGLLHGFGTGRIARACPGDVSIILEVRVTPKHGTMRETLPFYKVIATGPTTYAVGETEIYAINGRSSRRLPAPTFSDRCGLSIAQVEGVMTIRDPKSPRPRDLIGLGRFAMPAL